MFHDPLQDESESEVPSILTSSCSQEDASEELNEQDSGDADANLTMMDSAELYLRASKADPSRFSPPPGHDKQLEKCWDMLCCTVSLCFEFCAMSHGP